MTNDQIDMLFAFSSLANVRVAIHNSTICAEGSSAGLGLFSRYLYKCAVDWDCFFRCFNAGPYHREWFREAGI